MARAAMHRLASAHKVAAYARHVMPRFAQQLHSWMQLQHGTWCHASIGRGPQGGSIRLAREVAYLLNGCAQGGCSMARDAAHRLAAAHKMTAYAQHVTPRSPHQLHSWMQLQHGTRCHAQIGRCPRGGSVRSACDATLSPTAALLDAATAWHGMPCIDWLLPTRWQHTLGT